MIVSPVTLSLITTHQCTAACDHCCFNCTPKIKKRIPSERLRQIIDDASTISSFKVVVFTGGECFLLGDELADLISLSASHSFSTRCVTNGYWAINKTIAHKKVNMLVQKGLNELNFSTGPYHSKYVPVERVIHGAVASCEHGLRTIILIEGADNMPFDGQQIIDHPSLQPFIRSGLLSFIKTNWIEGDGQQPIEHDKSKSRFESPIRCDSVLKTITVTPSEDVVACCGLHLERIPELRLGNLNDRSFTDIVTKTPFDIIKLWIHYEGPERILEFVKQKRPTYSLPFTVHLCETCLHMYKDPVVREVIIDNIEEITEVVTNLATAGQFNQHVIKQTQISALKGAECYV